MLLYGVRFMTILTVTQASSILDSLIDKSQATHKPIIITGKTGNAVLLAEKYWTSINETLFLLSIPGMSESIQEGLKTNLDNCEPDLDT